MSLDVLAAGSPLDHVVSHVVFHLGELPVTNHMIMAGVAGVLMLLIFPPLFASQKAGAPSGMRNFFEAILQFLREDVFRPALKEHTDRFTPFLWTVFFFILFCNLLGFIPLNEFIIVATGGNAGMFAHVGGTATGNIATTAALALCAFFFIHGSGIWQVAGELMSGTYGHHGQESHALTHPVETSLAGAPRAGMALPSGHGMGAVSAIASSPFYYLWNFAPHLFKPKAGESPVGWIADLTVWGLLVLLELVGSLIKPFALCMRLFANMIAGHIVLAVLAGLIPVTMGILMQLGIGVPVTAMSLMIRLLELFVSFLQAYIFTFLTTLFIAAAVAPEH